MKDNLQSLHWSSPIFSIIKSNIFETVFTKVHSIFYYVCILKKFIML